MATVKKAVKSVDGWNVRNIEMKIKHGSKPGWFQVEIAGKKFVMKEVSTFYGEKSNSKVPF